MKKVTQEDRVLNYLKDNGTITSWEAIREFGITRLSARILTLRKRGHNITTGYKTDKNRYGDFVTFAVYKLEENNENN